MTAPFKLVFALLLFVLSSVAAWAKDVAVQSPDGNVRITVSTAAAKDVVWRVDWHGEPVLAAAPIGLRFAGKAAPAQRIAEVSLSTHDQHVTGLIGKASEARDQYNEAVIAVAGDSQPLELVVRAYDDGAAYRWRFRTDGPFSLAAETAGFGIADSARIWATTVKGFDSSYEEYYRTGSPEQATTPGALVTLPVLFHSGRAWGAITEAALHDWSGLYVTRSGAGSGLHGTLAPRLDVPGVAVIGTAGEHVSPWRVVMLGDAPGRLIESNLVTVLNPPPDDRDWSWVKPGKTSFPWWNNFVIPVKGSKPGLNTATMKAYIDFDAANGIRYHTLDGFEGEAWYGGPIDHNDIPQDVTRARPAIDMPEVLRYAKARGVEIRLWTHWKPFSLQIDKAFDTWAAWGIKGIMVDFMNRDDQQMVAFYDEVARKAADHRMTVVYHGAHKPTGSNRTWPNVLSYEAVRGTEYNKFGDNPGSTAEHEAIIPFTRMLAGPLDVHQGGFTYVAPDKVDASLAVPAVVGTRARSLADYVVLDNQLAMIADAPAHYADAIGFDFILAVPTAWDETRVLAGEVGDQIVVARRKGRAWWLGAKTDASAREVTVKLAMLGPGDWRIDAFADVGETRTARHTRGTVHAGDTLTLRMGTAGGYAARITPADEPVAGLGSGTR